MTTTSQDTAIGAAAGTVVPGVGNAVGAAVGTVVGVIMSLFGSQDAVRAARCQWFLSNAEQGNVAAAQCLLGGSQTVASHELPMYTTAIQTLQTSSVGLETWQEAVAAGPYWSLSDSASSYPNMQGFVTTWARNNGVAVAQVVGAVQNTTTTATTVTTAKAATATVSTNVSPLLLVGGGVVLVFLLMRDRR